LTYTFNIAPTVALDNTDSSGDFIIIKFDKDTFDVETTYTLTITPSLTYHVSPTDNMIILDVSTAIGTGASTLVIAGIPNP